MSSWTPDGSSPAVNAVTITPNDSTDLENVARALYIGTAGNISLIPSGPGALSVTFTNVQDGTILPISVSRVNATSTTAANIVALY